MTSSKSLIFSELSEVLDEEVDGSIMKTRALVMAHKRSKSKIVTKMMRLHLPLEPIAERLSGSVSMNELASSVSVV